jgi:hypothetical protein
MAWRGTFFALNSRHGQKPMTVTDMARMGGRARAAKYTREQLAEFSKNAGRPVKLDGRARRKLKAAGGRQEPGRVRRGTGHFDKRDAWIVGTQRHLDPDWLSLGRLNRVRCGRIFWIDRDEAPPFGGADKLCPFLRVFNAS